MLEERLEDVEKRMVKLFIHLSCIFLNNHEQRAGDFIPCFSSVLLENKEKYNLTNKEIAWAAGTLM